MTVDIETTEHGNQLGDVEFIWARNSKEFLFANSILIRGKTSVIVDPSATFTYIENLALSQTVGLVINTHYHGDHRSLNGLFKNVLFGAHELDAPAIRDHATYEEFADADQNSFYSEWRKQVFKQYHIVDCPISQLYKGGEIIDTGGEQIELIHTPGHTPGHLMLHFKNINCLYLADIDLTPYGPWYANVNSHILDFMRSVEKAKNFKADYYVSSHGERIYTPERFEEKINRFYQYFFEREEIILELLSKNPQGMEEICSEGIIYRKASLADPLKAYFQWKMVEKHLDKLINEKKIVKDKGVYAISSI